METPLFFKEMTASFSSSTFTGSRRLDPVNVELLKEAVISLKNSGVSIVFSSHRMEHVEELCENLCILQKGKPVVQGNLKDIKPRHSPDQDR